MSVHRSQGHRRSLVESGGAVLATFLSPANDPRFWSGSAPAVVHAVTPTTLAPGTRVTIRGKNLSQLSSVTGSLTLVANSGEVVATVPFTVTPASG
jgi:hypothetical protein